VISRREAVAVLASSTGLPLLSACVRDSESTAAMSENDAIALLDECGEHLLTLFPESATSLGIDTGSRAELRARLSDRSEAGKQRVAAQIRSDLARVDAVDASAMSFGTRTSLEVVKSAYRIALDGFALPHGDVTVGGWRNAPYAVIQNVGAYLDVPRFLDTDHRIESAADAEAYLARLEAYPAQLDGELGRIRAAREAGVVPPAFLLDKATQQLTLSVNAARAGGVLVESIERRSAGIPGAWAERARTIVVQQVAPALERQLGELETQRRVATDEPAVSARPGGAEFYRWALRAATTTSMSADEIHALGESELEGLHASMDALLREIDYTQGSVGARMQALARDPRYQFTDGDPGRAEILAFIDDRLAWVRAQMPRSFSTLVDPNMEVRRLPPEEEPGAPGAYGGAGSVDGTIPGRFWINLLTTDLHSRLSLADLTFHEAIPGHIWQGEYTHDMPLIRQQLAFNAYSEGWALYAEQLADELGAYEGDPAGRLGYLQSIAFRACRLVVDTGLHAMGWSREQAVRYFVDVNGSNPLEAASEVDRYCSWPGQACGHKVGHSEINRQRARAQAELGARYDLRAFNDAVVLGGNVPLDVLARNVDAYVSG
jgi:uncharacterized protein (DUF885 family)